MAGIITERDLLHCCAAGKCALEDMEVAEVMTTDVIPGSRRDALEKAMGLMTKKRIRHLPIVS